MRKPTAAFLHNVHYARSQPSLIVTIKYITFFFVVLFLLFLLHQRKVHFDQR